MKKCTHKFCTWATLLVASISTLGSITALAATNASILSPNQIIPEEELADWGLNATESSGGSVPAIVVPNSWFKDNNSLTAILLQNGVLYGDKIYQYVNNEFCISPNRTGNIGNGKNPVLATDPFVYQFLPHLQGSTSGNGKARGFLSSLLINH